MAARMQRLHHAGDGVARFHIEHVQVVLRDAAALARALRAMAERQIGMRQLTLHPGFELAGVLMLHEVGEAQRIGDLRRRQVLAFGQAADEGVAHRHFGQQLAHQPFARTGRRAGQLQVIGEAAAEGRVDLLDAVGHPQHRHRVALQNLVHPGLAIDRAAAMHQLLLACQQVGRLALHGREHVLHLVEQQGGARRFFQEGLRDLQRTVAVAPTQGVAVAVRVFHLEAVQPRSLHRHLGQLGLAGTRRAVEQDVDAGFAPLACRLQQAGDGLHILRHMGKVLCLQRGRHRQPGELGHQLLLAAVLAHQHGGQLVAHLHQVGQIGDRMLADQVVDHADALQPRAASQCIGHLARAHAGHIGHHGVGFGRAVDLEFHQQATQFALVARQRAVKQQRTFCGVELQQRAQAVNVLLHLHRTLAQALLHPLAGGGQQGQHVLGRVLDEFVQIIEQRAFFVGTAPDTVPLQKFGVAQLLVAGPEAVVTAAQRQKAAQPEQHMLGPDQMPAGQRHQRVDIPPPVEAVAVARREREHELRAQQIHGGCLFQCRRQVYPQLTRNVRHVGPPAHCARARRHRAASTPIGSWVREKVALLRGHCDSGR